MEKLNVQILNKEHLAYAGVCSYCESFGKIRYDSNNRISEGEYVSHLCDYIIYSQLPGNEILAYAGIVVSGTDFYIKQVAFHQIMVISENEEPFLSNIIEQAISGGFSRIIVDVPEDDLISQILFSDLGFKPTLNIEGKGIVLVFHVLHYQQPYQYKLN